MLDIFDEQKATYNFHIIQYRIRTLHTYRDKTS